MNWFDLFTILLVLAAAFSYINYKLLKLPTTIGLMALTLVASLAIVALGRMAPWLQTEAKALVTGLRLDRTLLHGMLGFLLFAGALHLDFGELVQHKAAIAVLATIGVVVSTVVVGLASWFLLSALGFRMHLIYCFLFGALVSPTDPIAVLALLKQLGAPRPLEVKIAGESLFNDGVGVVIFLGLLQVALGEQRFHVSYLGALFVREALGGAALGLAMGAFVYWLLRSVDNYQVEIFLSLALVAGGYTLADALGLSAAISMVVAGLLIGNHGRSFAMSKTTAQRLDLFWELIDEMLNAMLFVLLGFEALVLAFTRQHLIAGLLMIPIVLIARLLSVGLPAWEMRRWQRFAPGDVRVLTWGGLRGGNSVAMALSLPDQIAGQLVPERDTIVLVTYVVVVFSILVQGLTIGPLARRWFAADGRLPQHALGSH